jgi:hypothetical protein
MAQSFDTDAGTLVIPSAVFKTTVQTNPSGLATSGVLMVIGEAEAGPAFSEETDLSLNLYGPDQVSDFIAKYRSGPLVDGIRGASAAANDAQIPGSFSRFLAVKPNVGVKATATLLNPASGPYATITDKQAGKRGNLTSYQVATAVAESLPTTGNVVLAVAQVSTTVNFRVNGAAVVTAAISAGDTPTTMVSAINALAGVAATGGASRSLITAVAGNLTLTQDSGFQCHITIDTAWANVPTVGDIVYIPTSSPFAAANEGTYVCTAATTTRLDLYKVRDAAGAGSDRTAPATAGPVAVGATTNVQAFSPVVITLEAGAALSGTGKTLEIADTSTGSFATLSWVFAGATASPPAALATWNSVTGTPQTLTSVAESRVTVTVARAVDLVDGSVTTGGKVAFKLGYTGTTASAVIASGVLTITVVGGTGASQTITLADFPTINDLSSYLSTKTGYTASAEDGTTGQLSPSLLDEGTYAIATDKGAPNGRIKVDGSSFKTEVTAGQTLVDISNYGAAKPAGLPGVTALSFLTGGSKGATTNAAIQAALDALQACRGNFLVTCFSRDATGDISDGLTDAASTYTIDSINAAGRSHVLLMSQMKRRRPRQFFASFRGSFSDAQKKAGALASSRCAMFFQDAKDTNSAGTLTQFQPWMAAIKAAGMQAAGFYRPIVNKFINVSGVLVPGGGFNDQLDSDLETALLKGLCPIVRDESGGFRWVSDQTTYAKDSNFVYNSIQAVYVGDVIGTTVSQRMERAFVGQSVADISATLALTVLEGIMSDMKRLKLISASDDAPKGFKNATIRIVGPSMAVSLEIKLAGAIYFIPISFLVTPVQQSAG